MEQKIGRLIQEQLIVMILRLNYQLHRLFAYLLGYLIDSFVEKTGHIRSFRSSLPPPAFNDLFQAGEEIFPTILFVPARIRPGMTDRAQRQRFDQQRILVTIDRNALYQQVITAFFAFGP